MSWSVSAAGKAAAVRDEIVRQISAIKLTDEGEMETVKNVGITIDQALSTFGPDGLVRVEASGHMGYKDWNDKSGAFQQVTSTIAPIHLTV